MSEFSDRPFVAGSLIGMRAFAVDSLGRLMGPSYQQVFKPGENVAECRKPADGARLSFGGMTMSWPTFTVAPGTCPCGCGLSMTQTGISTSDPVQPRAIGAAGQIQASFDEATEKIEAKTKSLSEEAIERVEPPAPPPHSLAGVKCTCGFYAYFDGRNDYKDPTRVTALIEGYGVCTVGSAGFRAEKARLVALVRPGKRVATQLLERNYADVPFYETKRAALEAHPLTVDPLPSPADEDFWTREVR